TVFGQIVSGQSILSQMTQVARNNQDAPLSPITITSATLSPSNPDGVVHIDATGATSGQIATVTVTATEPSSNTTATQTFHVTVTPVTNNGPPFDSPAFLSGTYDLNPVIGPDQTFTLQIRAGTAAPGNTLVFQVKGGINNNSFTDVQNATATVS